MGPNVRAEKRSSHEAGTEYDRRMLDWKLSHRDAVGMPVAILVWVVLLTALGAAWFGCKQQDRRQVVVYVSVDQAHAEPVLAAFERARGIEVLPVYDVEANKAAGLARRILAERSHPRADVFWNGELVQTLMLSRSGVLAAYRSPSASDLPSDFVDPSGLWAGCAGRVRVFVMPSALAPDRQPSSIWDLAGDKAAPNEIGLSIPLFGTSATHAAALYAEVGPERARTFYETIKHKGVRIADGNSTVRDLVVQGKLQFGMVDTDDACEAVRRGANIRTVAPDQAEGSLGALVIPTTVAVVLGGPHPQEAKALVDFLLSPEAERLLVASGWSHAPARSHDVAPRCFSFPDLRRMRLDTGRLADMVDRSREDMRAVFLR